jgi:FKBP-type peptidyl-prolyl cis-trans isomerase FkpA
MNKIFLSFFLLVSVSIKAAIRDSTTRYPLPDSVRVAQFMAEVKIESNDDKRPFSAGIATDLAGIYIKANKRKRTLAFQCNDLSEIASAGLDVYQARSFDKELVFQYDWKYGETYKLLITEAADSAANLTLCSGYIWLPAEAKWKLLGSFRSKEYRGSLKNLNSFLSTPKSATNRLSIDQLWCQRQNGTWKNLLANTQPVPVINLYNHVDSIRQQAIDIKLIADAIKSGKTDAKNQEQGIYYTMLKEGSGRLVNIHDTLTVYYKGYLFGTDSIFSQATDKPASFPLKMLIRGWQIGVPLCKIGGKIKLIIPSGQAYSIRTRSAKIPPNSILVFEVEILDAKAPQ